MGIVEQIKNESVHFYLWLAKWIAILIIVFVVGCNLFTSIFSLETAESAINLLQLTGATVLTVLMCSVVIAYFDSRSVIKTETKGNQG